MGDCVVILDDTAARLVAMRAVLVDLLPRRDVVTFDNAPAFIDWLPRGLPDAVLICLDHDLGPHASARRNGRPASGPGHGPGCGEALAAFPPVCPVIVHSTNAAAVPGMTRVLTRAGWPYAAVTPFGDLEWIGTIWRAQVEAYIARGWIEP